MRRQASNALVSQFFLFSRKLDVHTSDSIIGCVITSVLILWIILSTFSSFSRVLNISRQE